MNKYLVKVAASKSQMSKSDSETVLKPYQIRALAKLDKTHGILLAHGTGTGKTMTYLTAVEQSQARDKTGRSLIIAPASLETNIANEIRKHNLKIDVKRLDIMSYDKATRDSERLKKNKYVLAIADEAQKLRNTNTQRSTELGEIIENANYRILATATPSYNNTSDIAPLVNLAAGGAKILPEDKKAFEQMYVDKRVEAPPLLKRIFGAPSKEVSSLKNKKDLKSRLNKYVDFYDVSEDPETIKHFPTKEEKTIEVPMSAAQHQLYKYMEGKLPWPVRLKIRANMPLTKKESSQLNAFSSGIRQVSNSTTSFMPKLQQTTPKIETAIKSMQESMDKDKNFKGLVYSNYLQSGVEDYAKELDKRGIPYGLYTGKLNKIQKDELVHNYNSGKTKILLVSSSGGEGLDLKGTRKVQVLEPHFNRSKIEQVIGRAARYNSHAALPQKDRTVEIENYQSVFPPGPLGKSKSKSIDQYLTDNSAHKDELSTEMKHLMDESNNN